MEPLTFNTLLNLSGIAPGDVLLMRHTFKSYKETSPFMVWLLYHQDGKEDFLRFQNIQDLSLKINRRYVASFVVDPNGETLFVGLFENTGIPREVPFGTVCPVTDEKEFLNHQFYNLSPTNLLKSYEGKLIIDWGKAHVKWYQQADTSGDKLVMAIREEITEKRFPGFDRFICNLNQLDLLPKAWQEVLSQNKGIYLLKCLQSGKQYVGSAYSQESFWGRFSTYHKTGHGHNKQMKTHHAPLGYQATVLEVLPSGFKTEQVVERENIWKDKLLSRHSTFGLNAN